DVVQRIVQLVRDASGELAESRKLSGLYELLLFVSQLLLAMKHLRRRLAQIIHYVDHRLASSFKPQVRLMRVFENVQDRAARVVESLALTGEPSPVPLVVDHDVKHRLALIGKPLIELIHVAHYVNQGAATLFASDDTVFERPDLLEEFCLAFKDFLKSPLLELLFCGNRGHRSVVFGLGPDPADLLTQSLKLSLERDHLQLAAHDDLFKLFEVEDLLLKLGL